MNSKESAGQSAPVDLVTTGKLANPGPPGPTMAQIRIPNVSAALRPTGLIQPGVGPRAAAAAALPTRPIVGPRSSTPLGKPGASITMLPGGGAGKVTVVPAPALGQLITPRSSHPIGTRQTLTTRPILAQPVPTRSPTSPQTRAALATPMLRGVAPGNVAVSGSHALTLRAPLHQNLSGSIRLPPSSVQWVQTSTRPMSTTRPSITTSTRPPTVLPVGTRTVTAVSFRPTGPVVARPTLVSPGGGPVSLVQTAGTKTIVTQNPAGVFKPITTQISVPGQPVALKPAAVSATTVRTQATGQRVSGLVSLTQAPTHIQVPMVPGATGPAGSKGTRVAVSAQSIHKLVSSLPVGLVTSVGGTGRTISLPYSVGQAKIGPGTQVSTGSIPVARVVPQPVQARNDQSSVGSTGYVVTGGAPVFVQGPRPVEVTQSGPVNLTVSDRSAFTSRAGVPAMSMPNFTQSTFLYDSQRDQQSSVTITTLPPQLQDQGPPASHGPATITPARITPILPPTVSIGPPGMQPSGTQQEQDKMVPGSPRPSILRKRPDGTDLTPIKGNPPHISGPSLHSPGSPPRPDSSGSSTISAISSLPALSGDEGGRSVPAPPALEPSPRKKPRKQQLPPRETSTNISPEWAAVKRELGARDRLEWNTRPEPDWEGRVRNWNRGEGGGGGSWTTGGEVTGEVDLPEGPWGDNDNLAGLQADDEEEMSTDEESERPGNFIQGKPTMSLLNSYRYTWKSRHNHFLRYSDVKSKDERRPTVNELANQKYVLQKINGWKIFHLSAGMEDIVDMESELSKRLQEIGKRLEDAANKEVSKESIKVQELIKANIQRSKVIQDQIKEAKDNAQSIFEHKPKIQEIIVKYQSKRSLKGRRDN